MQLLARARRHGRPHPAAQRRRAHRRRPRRRRLPPHRRELPPHGRLGHDDRRRRRVRREGDVRARAQLERPPLLRRRSDRPADDLRSGDGVADARRSRIAPSSPSISRPASRPSSVFDRATHEHRQPARRAARRVLRRRAQDGAGALRVPRGNAGERRSRRSASTTTISPNRSPANAKASSRRACRRVTAELTPLDAIVSARVTATEAAGTLEASNALFRAGHADQARQLIVQEQAKLAETRRQVVKLAPVERRPECREVFRQDCWRPRQRRRWFHATDSGGRHRTNRSARSAHDHKGQAQVRKNQQDAIELSE